MGKKTKASLAVSKRLKAKSLQMVGMPPKTAWERLWCKHSWLFMGKGFHYGGLHGKRTIKIYTCKHCGSIRKYHLDGARAW